MGRPFAADTLPVVHERFHCQPGETCHMTDVSKGEADGSGRRGTRPTVCGVVPAAERDRSHEATRPAGAVEDGRVEYMNEGLLGALYGNPKVLFLLFAAIIGGWFAWAGVQQGTWKPALAAAVFFGLVLLTVNLVA